MLPNGFYFLHGIEVEYTLHFLPLGFMARTSTALESHPFSLQTGPETPIKVNRDNYVHNLRENKPLHL